MHLAPMEHMDATVLSGILTAARLLAAMRRIALFPARRHHLLPLRSSEHRQDSFCIPDAGL